MANLSLEQMSVVDMGRFKRRKTSSADDELDARLLHHIKNLDLSSVDDYRDWCAQHGFSRRLNKSWNERCRERYVASSSIAHDCLKTRRRESRNPVETMVAICHLDLTATDLVQSHLKLLARAVRKLPVPSYREPATRAALARLLQTLSSARSGFFHEAPVISQLGRQKGNTYIEALVAIASHSLHWRRRPDTWKSRSKNTRRQFESLLRHLFCDYAMPKFFDSVWFLGSTPTARVQQSWYVNLGKGGSVRDFNFPIPYTRRMAHCFMQAPHDLTVQLAIRWGQLRTFGFTDKQLRALLEIEKFQAFTKHDEFWTSVFRWLARHPTIDPCEYGPLIDYIHNQRFVPEQQIFGRDDHRPDPPQPNFSMQRRHPQSLLRQMYDWHKQLSSDNTLLEANWRRSGFPDFDLVEGQGNAKKLWTIRELLCHQALIIEGRKLNHCVASYRHSCQSGGSSIWTMEVQTYQGKKKRLTIEVQNSRGRIVQARGRANRRPQPREIAILRQWTAEAGLTLGIA